MDILRVYERLRGFGSCQGLLIIEEMNENPEKSSSSLAIATEKRTHRPGGCVGIFFQLFDWNRRFAKKKLFSMKLLPPGHSLIPPDKLTFLLCYSLYLFLST